MYNEKNFIKDLEQLTNIDSGTHNIEGVNKVVTILEKTFKDELHFDVKRVTISKEAGDILVACNKKDAEAYDVLLLGHMDTVYAKLAAEHPLSIRDNKAYALGSVDMKAGILQAIYALKSIDKAIIDKLSICFLCNSDEEIGSFYTAPTIIEYAKKSKCALVFESALADNCLLNARYGSARFYAHFTGVAAHGSAPAEGVSAIRELAHFVELIHNLNKADKSIIANVGVVKAGTGFNIVPDKATLSFEFRFVSIEGYHETIAKINSFVRHPMLSGSKINLEKFTFKPPLRNTKENKWLEDMVLKSCDEIGLKDFTLTSHAGGSDGNATSYYAKIATLDGLGPVGEGLHNQDKEYIELASIESRIKLLQQLLLNLSK